MHCEINGFSHGNYNVRYVPLRHVLFQAVAFQHICV